METKKQNDDKNFHAVDFMRQVRAELTEQFLKDKQKYLDYLHQAMADFKTRQAQTSAYR